MKKQPRVASGLDVVARDGLRFLRHRRFALLVNPTAVDRDLRGLLNLALAAGHTPRAIFSPEHGLSGAAQDMIAIGGRQRGALKIPCYSLYGDSFASLSPTKAMLKGIDLLVYDIQDVGSRYYTFAATLVLCMRACARMGIEVAVLDRPNPIGGAIEGAPVDPGYESFVGLYAVPNRHGLTVGELAQYANDALDTGCALTVYNCAGWKRSLWYDETGLPWVPPSPNMPTLDTATVYPGGCLYEGTNLSEGRGTTRPFELVGAPFIDPDRFAAELNGYELAGVTFRPARFTPTFHKWKSEDCGGVQLHVTDRDRFKPLLAGIAVLKAARDLYGRKLRWRTEKYEFVDDKPAIDLLAGGPWLRQLIDRHAPLPEIAASYTGYEKYFKRQMKAYLSYM